jgi:hypothetical protein
MHWLSINTFTAMPTYHGSACWTNHYLKLKLDFVLADGNEI